VENQYSESEQGMAEAELLLQGEFNLTLTYYLIIYKYLQPLLSHQLIIQLKSASCWV